MVWRILYSLNAMFGWGLAAWLAWDAGRNPLAILYSLLAVSTLVLGIWFVLRHPLLEERKHV